MREDMTKVLVEEPRHGRGYARSVQGARRQRWNRLDPDGEGGPIHVGMRRDGLTNKDFGEHLGPLYRYLRQQVNRPWDKVYGELCSVLDRRNVVQNHLFQHISDRIAIETKLVEGEVLARSWRTFQPVRETRYEMYVHPRTRLLLVNRGRENAAHRRAAKRVAEAQKVNEVRRVDIPGLAPDRQWHRIDGLWFEVALLRLIDDVPVYDVVLRRNVSTDNRALLKERYGAYNLYATAKRQLNHQTMVRHGLI